MMNKEECLNAIDVIARYCNEVKQGHVPPRFELTNELDILMQLIQGCFAKSKVVLDEPMTICQCCEYLATMIDDKELLKTIDYIEERATAMYNKLIERKEEVEKYKSYLNQMEIVNKKQEKDFKLVCSLHDSLLVDYEKVNTKVALLEKALDKACGLLKEAVSQDCYIFDEVIEENYSYITEKEEWKEWCLKDEGGDR